MDNLPPVSITDSAVSSWGNKVNQHVRQNQLGTSSDFLTSKSGSGTSLQLKRKFKAGYEFFRYKGEFDPDKAYSLFDVIRVMPDEDYTDADGNVIDATPGVFICVVNVPSLKFTNLFTGDREAFKRYLRQDETDYFPQWPEPETKATLSAPDGRYWELISLLPMEVVSCENGIEKTQYVDATPKPEGE
jgi:hypothetical protein